MIYLDTSNSENSKLFIPDRSKKNTVTVFFNQDVSEISRIQVFLESYLEQEFHEINYNINEIFLIVDEIISNAIISSFNKNPQMNKENLICRWKTLDKIFIFQTIDFGLGLDLNKTKKEVPNLQSDNYFSEVIKYQKSHEIEVLNQGKAMRHQCTGRGLGIIREFSNSIEIKYIGRNWELQNSIDDQTVGTIFTCIYPLVKN